MVARQMSPQRGRFLTSDPYLGERTHPATLQRYAYAEDDPVNRYDPTGRMAEEEVEAAGIEAEMNVQEIELAQPITDEAVDASSEVESVADETANELVAEDEMELARSLGRAGEDAAEIVKNTERIPSATGTANYRIPDELDFEREVLGEVKNVGKLGRTKQLEDFAIYARESGLHFRLFVRIGDGITTGTRLSGPLMDLIEEYGIEVIQKIP